MKRGRDVTDQIERVLFAQAEVNYMSGATALVQQEIALTQQSMYHKPAYSRNWSWDYQAEARIRGGKAVKQHDWDDFAEKRAEPYADELEGRPVFRDVGSSTVLTDTMAPPIGTKIVKRGDVIYQGYDPSGSRDKPREKGLLAHVK